MGRKATLYLLGNLLILFSAAALVAALLCRHVPDAPQTCGWLLAGLAAPVLFVLNVCLLVWWLVRRRWQVALIPLVALIAGGSDMASLVQLPRMGNPAAGELRVASLNVHGFQQERSREFSAHRIGQMLREERIDVACLQEVLDDAEHPFDTLATQFTKQFPYFVRELSMACFSRYPIVDHKYVRFPESNQSYLRIDVQIGKQKVRFISVHLQTTGISTAQRHFKKSYGIRIPSDSLFRVFAENAAVRMVQVREIRQLIDTSSMPLIVAGDFNDTPVSQTYHTMRKGLTDAFRVAGHGWGGSYRGAVRIDYIFYNDYFEAVDYRVLHREELSDHDPVIAELRFVR